MKYLTIAATALALSAGAASAATILDTASLQGGATASFGNFSNDQDPLGQTFTLSSATNNIFAGGYFADRNQQNGSGFDLTFSIYSGAGFSGTLLGSVNVSLADNFNGIHTESFSSLGTLSAGTYTLGFSSNGVFRGALGVSDGDFASTDAYNEVGIFNFTSVLAGKTDFSVVVTGDSVTSPSPVPLPAGFPLLAAGLIGLGVLARRKKAA